MAARADDAEQEGQYRDRIVAYMQKAMREAKVFTSWLNPSEPHEQAMTRFVEMRARAREHARSGTTSSRSSGASRSTASTTRWRS